MSKKKIIFIVISVIVGIALLLLVADKIIEVTGGDVKAELKRAMKVTDTKLLDYDYLGRDIDETLFGDYIEYCYFGARIKNPDGSKIYVIAQMTFISKDNGEEDGDLEFISEYENKSDYKRAIKEFKKLK
ncbi:MAG: hypothetical protein IKH65_10115 [Clostridia bacterium]|nr:hypothetical protein [Clostridia bacterium]